MKIAFAGFFAIRLAALVRDHLTIPCEVIEGDEASILPRLGDADVLVSMGFNRQMAEAAPRLRLVQVAGAGLDRIDRGAFRPGLRLANVYGHEAGIAEYVMGAMLALTRSFGRLDASLRQGRWDSQWAIGTAMPPPSPELAGKTLGILGFGHIGEALARRASAFDMQVCAVRSKAQADVPPGVSFIGGPEQTDEVLRQSDYLAVTLSLSEATRGLLDANRLGLMKPTAFLVNVARAEIADEDALFEALSSRAIAGAALDVWYRYPTVPGPVLPANRPFHELDNVLMTPHVSGWTEGMLEARARLIAGNIERTARGELPVNLIETAG